MRKPRLDYAYVAYRIDPYDGQNLGDFAIRRRFPADQDGYRGGFTYHYGSEDWPEQHYRLSRKGRLVNRMTLNQITRGSTIWNECMKAIDRLKKEEEA